MHVKRARSLGTPCERLSARFPKQRLSKLVVRMISEQAAGLACRCDGFGQLPLIEALPEEDDGLCKREQRGRLLRLLSESNLRIR